MSINVYLPHILIIPEDEALGDAGIGFAMVTGMRQIRVEREVGGRDNLLEKLKVEEIKKLGAFPNRVLVLLTDFDNGHGRQKDLEDAVPKEFRERVFILGPWSNFEVFRKEMITVKKMSPNTRSRTGEILGEECAEGDMSGWKLDQLTHLKDEVDRARQPIRSILWG